LTVPAAPGINWPGVTRRFSHLSLGAAALALLACRSQAPLTVAVPETRGGVCSDLAYAFFLVAEKKDRGASKDAQIEALRQSIDTPFATQPDQTLRHLERVVEIVYRNPELSARQIEAKVREDCVVDEQGRAVLPRIWPRQAARR
jgi:hypothetical protein